MIDLTLEATDDLIAELKRRHTATLMMLSRSKTEEAEEAGVKSEEAAAESSTEVLQNDEGNAYVELSSKKRCTIRKYRNVSNILDLSVLKEIRVFCLHHPLCDPTPDPAASRPCSSISERRTRRTARRFRERRVSA